MTKPTPIKIKANRPIQKNTQIKQTDNDINQQDFAAFVAQTKAQTTTQDSIRQSITDAPPKNQSLENTTIISQTLSTQSPVLNNDPLQALHSSLEKLNQIKSQLKNQSDNTKNTLINHKLTTTESTGILYPKISPKKPNINHMSKTSIKDKIFHFLQPYTLIYKNLFSYLQGFFHFFGILTIFWFGFHWSEHTENQFTLDDPVSLIINLSGLSIASLTFWATVFFLIKFCLKTFKFGLIDLNRRGQI